ncbi:MAG: ferredoxin-thioredoxin reductase catalytic domain-containing protein [Parcubacteria group bacterium]
MTTGELIKKYEEYAKENGFLLNPNNKIAEGVVNGLLAREEKFGERYCPCRRVTGNKEEDKKIICPCIYHKEEIKKDGHCYCNLFVGA